MRKEKIKSAVKLKVVELSEGKVVELQQFFLDKFLFSKRFGTACHALSVNGLPEGVDAEAVVSQWIEDCPGFKTEYEKAKRIVERAKAERAEEFLHDVGTGKQRTGKDSGITSANVIGAHMVLEAIDKQKWSSKVAGEKKADINITTIVKHYGAAETRVEVIDAPETKLLPQGENGNSDEE
jgi:hypothetical protein